MSMKNVDDILISNPQPSPSSEIIKPVIPKEEVYVENPDSQESDGADQQEEKLNYLEKFREDKKEFLGEKDEEIAENVQKEPEKYEKHEIHEKSDDEVDDYGNKIQSKKVYTEEEVQNMIRKRLKERHDQPQQQYQASPQQVQQAQDSFQHDPNSEETWEVQLDRHIRGTIQKIQNEQQENAFREHQNQLQKEFEEKFDNGRSKYSDFLEVVKGKPITNAMMMSTRSMEDPAAFIYAASKLQPQELQRIANISDPYQQAAEMGKLEERMRKAKTKSSAPKPGTKIRSDMPEKYSGKPPSIDDKILHDAQKRFSNGRR